MPNYCGKNCDTCAYREELSCSGCQSGPGRENDGDCELARCCREKGHETCETCVHKKTCVTWLDKGSIPRRRIEHRAKAQELGGMLARRAPFLARWLSVLLFLMIPRFVGSLLGSNVLAGLLPELEYVGKLLQQGTFFVQAVVLLWMSKEHKGYRTAGLLGLGDCILYAVVAGGGISEEFAWLAVLVEAVLVLSAAYYEYKAHAELVQPFQGLLAEMWKILWRLQMCIVLSYGAGIFLIPMSPLVGLLVTLAAVIGMALAMMKKIICLRRTAGLFREIAKKNYRL